MPTFFISDLHLNSARPEVTSRFFQFLDAITAPSTDALFILGDFFERWIGDDDPDLHHQSVIERLAQFTATGIPVSFMRGNRDFLIGNTFANRTGCSLITDPSTIELYGEKILLTHGDALCTLDRRHQRFRKIAQHPWTQKAYLTLPIHFRKMIAERLRHASRKRHQSDTPNLLPLQDPRFNVTQTAVIQSLVEHNALCLIHGHTHIPGIHEFKIQDASAKRIVLGEWGAQGHFLSYSKGAFLLHNF